MKSQESQKETPKVTLQHITRNAGGAMSAEPLAVCREPVDSRFTILDVFPDLHLRSHVPLRTLSRTA